MRTKYDKILIIDLEAQCWDKEVPEGFGKDIIEIGLATVNFKTLDIERHDEIIVKPEKCQISSFCKELTSIDQEMIDKNGIHLREACDILINKFSGKKRAWGSWGNYDRKHLKLECHKNDIKYPLSENHWNIKSIVVPFFGWNKEMGLKNAIEKLGMEFDGNHHRGCDDAFNTAKILVEVLKKSRDYM